MAVFGWSVSGQALLYVWRAYARQINTRQAVLQRDHAGLAISKPGLGMHWQMVSKNAAKANVTPRAVPRCLARSPNKIYGPKTMATSAAEAGGGGKQHNYYHHAS